MAFLVDGPDGWLIGDFVQPRANASLAKTGLCSLCLLLFLVG